MAMMYPDPQRSPTKPASPISPTSTFSAQQAGRTFMSLGASAVRGQTSPFPSTPIISSFLEPPSGMSYAEFIRTWTDDHVAQWLADTKCSNHAATFKANDIRGDVILELDQVILKEMGVSSIGDRLRILNAVKMLRQRVNARNVPNTPTVPSSARHFEPSNADDDLKRDRSDIVPGSLTRVPSRRLDTGRPAPLQLPPANRGDLPRLIREQGPESARLPSHNNIRPLPQPLQTNSTASASTSAIPTAATPSTGRQNLPPLPPVPRGQPPPPPPSRPPARSGLATNALASGRRTPTQSEQVTANPTQSNGLLTPSSASWTGYHLPPDPRPQNVTGAPGRATSPLQLGRSSSRGANATPSHNRHGSSGINSPARTAGPSSHPYAGSGQGPSQHNLSPIVEAFASTGNSRGTPSPPSASFTVGRGPFQPNTPSATPTHSNVPSLDDLRRKHVKFHLPQEVHSSTSVTIDVSSCKGGMEVLEKVLKKIGKSVPKSDNSVVITESGGLAIGGWAVYINGGKGPDNPLSEAEIMAVCMADPDSTTRERGLALRKVTAPSSRYPPSSAMTRTDRASRRASAVSILSDLGVEDPEKALDPPSSPSKPSAKGSGGSPTPSLSPPASSKRPSKLRNFFGQRPPSELITTHLTEYFPFTEKKVLQRTARHSSMLRMSMARDRHESSASWNPPISRFSSSTIGSQSRASFNISPRTSVSVPSRPSIDMSPRADSSEISQEEVPRVSLSTDDSDSVELDGTDDSSRPPVTSSGHLLPPIPFPTDSLSESLEDFANGSRTQRPLSMSSRRMSYMTELRSKRDRSDTASLMTVDEITANVESRRDSSSEESSDLTNVDDTEGTSTLLDDEEAFSNEEKEPVFEDDKEREGENKENTREAIKWIKGALIGAGSFGKVYLGMDAASGFLMAVKQVELPTGSAPNEARKKSMLSALEREIELLQDLQHENIVQYLHSSLDDEFLNIFLEYVPGGSVATLLSNYGAFEEPLVKNFVRQILQGLNYLHERDIIHRDIKGANILVDNKGGVKISDFGISKKVEDNLYGGSNRAHRPSLQGSVFWMAPEVVKQSGHTKKADIWSVGCLVVEMLTGDHPWSALNQMQAIFKIGSSAKPEIPSDISQDAQAFLTLTFELDQHARPSADELLKHKWVTIPKKPTFLSSKAKTFEVNA